MPEPSQDERTIAQILKELGTHLGFIVKQEVEASESAFVDLVWFDNRFPIPPKHFRMRYAFVLPVIAFEIERNTARNAKHVKGSVSNLTNLGAQLGVIVIGEPNLAALQDSPAFKGKKRSVVRKSLCDRVYRWVYAEAQPKTRIVVMFEDQLRAWAISHDTCPKMAAVAV
jgi:hypothetical protein